MRPVAPVTAPTTWPAARRILVAVSLAAAGAGALLLLAVDGLQARVVAVGLAHVAATVAAARNPAVGGLPALSGAAVAALALLGAPSDEVVWAVVPLTALAVLTAESSGAAGELAVVVPGDHRPRLVRALLAGAGALVASLAVVVSGAVDGPGGLAATVLACVAVAALVALVARDDV